MKTAEKYLEFYQAAIEKSIMYWKRASEADKFKDAMWSMYCKAKEEEKTPSVKTGKNDQNFITQDNT